MHDAKESPAEDDACYEWNEDRNEDSGAEVTAMSEESAPENNDSNVLSPSIIITIEGSPKIQVNRLKEHHSVRRIPATSSKGMLIDNLSK